MKRAKCSVGGAHPRVDVQLLQAQRLRLVDGRQRRGGRPTHRALAPAPRAPPPACSASRTTALSLMHCLEKKTLAPQIRQLQQAQEQVPFFYVREIPNKPPPPYTPPGQARAAAVAAAVSVAGEAPGAGAGPGGRPPAAAPPLTGAPRPDQAAALLDARGAGAGGAGAARAAGRPLDDVAPPLGFGHDPDFEKLAQTRAHGGAHAAAYAAFLFELALAAVREDGRPQGGALAGAWGPASAARRGRLARVAPARCGPGRPSPRAGPAAPPPSSGRAATAAERRRRRARAGRRRAAAAGPRPRPQRRRRAADAAARSRRRRNRVGRAADARAPPTRSRVTALRRGEGRAQERGDGAGAGALLDDTAHALQLALDRRASRAARASDQALGEGSNN
ncbi:Protein of unknown function, partial [Gryllus bimaculatus]